MKIDAMQSIMICIALALSFAHSGESGFPIKPKKVRCRDAKHLWCHLLWQHCPVQCPTSCAVDCVTCKPVCSCNYPGAVCQDPRFVGGDGVAFYFHGKKDKDFCLVSDDNLHINARFIGKRGANMTRDFTWVQSIGILYDDHQILVAAKKTSTWDSNVDRLTLALDGKSIPLRTGEGALWGSSTAPYVRLTRISETNSVSIEVEGILKVTAVVVPITAEESRKHAYNITDENCFAHLELGFKFYKLSDNVDGVLGQTYRKNYVTRVKMVLPMPVMGGNDKFSASRIFAADCAASQFIGHNLPGKTITENAALHCSSSRIQGLGVVCKK
ncbi:hypothetical protein Scep_003276 [Stephania cephalantha]|uniref:Root cap n=1 Tax=Stephania cephalantha TaxID=152367 RepID=A0AAP0KQ68_9MAGN